MTALTWYQWKQRAERHVREQHYGLAAISYRAAARVGVASGDLSRGAAAALTEQAAIYSRLPKQIARFESWRSSVTKTKKKRKR